MPMSMFKLAAGLVGLMLVAVIATAVVGVAAVFAAPVVAQDSLSASPSSWGCAPEPWPYGCQWRGQPVKRIFIRGPRPD